MHFLWWIAASAGDEIAQVVLRTQSVRMPPNCVVDAESATPLHSGVHEALTSGRRYGYRDAFPAASSTHSHCKSGPDWLS